MTHSGDRTLPRPGKPGGASDRGAPARTYLVAFHREGARVQEVTASHPIVIGRSAPADLVFEDRMLSRQHARLSLDEGAVIVEDLGSTNGTSVNGETVRRARVRPGDDVRLGDLVVSVHVERGAVELPANVDDLDRWEQSVADECVRAAAFGRAFSLAMFRSTRRGTEAHVGRWASAILSTLRTVDRAAFYGADAVVVLFPELAQDAAIRKVAELLDRDRGLRASLVSYPLHGTSADALIQCLRDTLLSERLHATTDGPQTPLRVPDTADSATTPGVADGVIARSAAMVELYGLVDRAAPSVLPVLVLGETGSGKEVVAKALHVRSTRAGGPMRSVNCATIPASLIESTLFGHEKGAFTGAERTSRGLFEQAHGGTIFLDEVGEMSPAAQAALLRVLETQTLMRVGGEREVSVDVRVVAATHRDLEAACEQGSFRWDLYYRLNGLTLRLPPLRERQSDIEPLIDWFVREANRVHGRAVQGIEPAALEALKAWRWPGNVRELRNAIDRGVVMARGSTVGLDDLPERVRGAALAAPNVPSLQPSASASSPAGSSSQPKMPSVQASDRSSGPADATSDEGEYRERVRKHMNDFETQLIVDALQRTDWNVTEAARVLQIPVRTLAHKMQTMGIRRPTERT